MAATTPTPDDVPREPPVAPEDWECCGSDCGEACLFSIYQREKWAYEAWLKQQSSEQNP